MSVVSLFVAAVLQLGADQALTGPLPTSLWLDADAADGNPGRCGWYLSGFELLGMNADERRRRTAGCEVSIRLRGTINPAGADYFRDVSDLLVELDVRPSRIVLNSRGGDADAAFAIARRIRNDPLYRRVGDGVVTAISDDDTAVCFSACLFIFAAGFERRAEFDIFGDPRLASRLGLHRPAQFRRQDGSFDTDRSNPDIVAVENKMRRYFRAVGVDPRIVDDMFAVPFDEIRLISRDDALAYGLIESEDRTAD